MTRPWAFVMGAMCGMLAMAVPKFVTHLHAAFRTGRSTSEGARTHAEEKFAFTADAPLEQVALLFGADKERMWAPGWNPQFVHPVLTADQQGMVFTTAHDHSRSAVWINTLFDLQHGRIQYVYVVPGALATLIDLKLTPQGEHTKVEVKYDRTSLSSETDEHVRRMAEADRRSGPEWEQQINGYLATLRR